MAPPSKDTTTFDSTARSDSTIHETLLSPATPRVMRIDGCPRTDPTPCSHHLMVTSPTLKRRRRMVRSADDTPIRGKRPRADLSLCFAIPSQHQPPRTPSPSQTSAPFDPTSPASRNPSPRRTTSKMPIVERSSPPISLSSIDIPSIRSSVDLGSSLLDFGLTLEDSAVEKSKRVYSATPVNNVEERRILRRWYSSETIEASRVLMWLDSVDSESSKQGAIREEMASRSPVTRSLRSSLLLPTVPTPRATPATLTSAKSNFPSRDIDISILEVAVSAEEILTFFPGHLSWSSVMTRLLRNGWDEHSMATYLNYSRNWRQGDQHAYTAAKMKRHVDAAMEKQFGRRYSLQERRGPGFSRDWPPISYLTPRRFRYQGNRVRCQDVTLKRLAQGVVFWPRGIARGLLTAAVETAAGDPEFYYNMGHVNLLLELGGEFALDTPPGVANHDTDGLRRNKDILNNEVWKAS